MSALSAIAGKKHKGIETKEYTDYYGGFESKKKNLVMLRGWGYVKGCDWQHQY